MVQARGQHRGQTAQVVHGQGSSKLLASAPSCYESLRVLPATPADHALLAKLTDGANQPYPSG